MTDNITDTQYLYRWAFAYANLRPEDDPHQRVADACGSLDAPEYVPSGSHYRSDSGNPYPRLLDRQLAFLPESDLFIRC